MPKRTLGCKFDPQDERDFMFQAGRIKLPPAVNNKAYLTPIKNQKNEGSCTGFAVTKAVEIAYWKKTLQQPNLSERWAYERAKENDEWPGSKYEGSSIRGGLKGVFKTGICPESLWPYIAGKKGRAKANAAKKAGKFKIRAYKRITGMQSIKAALFQNGVVVASAMVHRGWWNPKKVIRFNPRWSQEGGHAFIICGYNKQGLMIANSWGRRWGQKGCSIITYRDARLNLMDTWTLSV